MKIEPKITISSVRIIERTILMQIKTNINIQIYIKYISKQEDNTPNIYTIGYNMS